MKKEIEIGEDETTGDIWNKLSEIGGKLLVETLEKIEKGEAPRIKQSEDFTMAPMLSKEDAKIDFKNMTATQIKNLVRGLNPIMGAFAYLDSKKIKIWKAQAIEEKTFVEKQAIELNKSNEEAGTVLLADSKLGLYIKSKEGILKVLEIQGENSKRMPVEDYLRGNSIEKGRILE